MSPFRRQVLALICVLMSVPVVGTAAEAQVGLKSPRDAVEILVNATKAGDSARIAALYAPEAVLMLPALPPFTGRAAIEKAYQGNFTAGANTLSFSSVRTETGTDRAAIVWEWTLQVVPTAGQTRTIAGRSLVYFRRFEEGWMISADMAQVR